jgi:hypothetical protein
MAAISYWVALIYALADLHMARRKHHHVYVIELSKDVLLEPRFRKNNPG